MRLLVIHSKLVIIQSSATLDLDKEKNNMTYNMKEIANLCLDHNVDFEVMHGNNNTNFRTAFLINVGEIIRVDFGAASHGSLASRVHVADDHIKVVKIDDLINSIKEFHNPNRWGNKSATRVEQQKPYRVADKTITLEGSVIDGSIFLNYFDGVFVGVKFKIRTPKNIYTVCYATDSMSSDFLMSGDMRITGYWNPGWGFDADTITAK